MRILLLAAVCSAVIAGPADARRKPPLKRACQLATIHEVSAIMGRKMVVSANTKTGCGWQSGPKAQAGLEIYGYKTLAGAKQALEFDVQDFELCVDPPDHFLPGSGLGDDAWVDACTSNIAFRVGRVTAEVTAFSEDVQQGSSADTHRTAALVRRIVKRLRMLRCTPSFCDIQ